MATSIDLFIGVVYGSIAGRKRGKIDECMMRIADIIYSIPYLLVVILLTVVLEPGFYTIFIASLWLELHDYYNNDLTIPSAIFAEAFLSFLGLGVQAPIANWGTIASDGLSALRYYPWRLFFPSFFISLTMLCFNIIGDGKKRDWNAFQDPLTFLNPKVKIGKQIIEGFKLHFPHASKAQVKTKLLELMYQVRIPQPELRLHQYPHE
ncbi:hypothetical protein ACTFIW_008768 [Dictyostelium discoideum]